MPKNEKSRGFASDSLLYDMNRSLSGTETCTIADRR